MKERVGSRPRWIQGEPGVAETAVAGLVAGALGLGVGLVSFYLTRTVLAREPLSGQPGTRDDDGGHGEGTATEGGRPAAGTRW